MKKKLKIEGLEDSHFGRSELMEEEGRVRLAFVVLTNGRIALCPRPSVGNVQRLAPFANIASRELMGDDSEPRPELLSWEELHEGVCMTYDQGVFIQRLASELRTEVSMAAITTLVRTGTGVLAPYPAEAIAGAASPDTDEFAWLVDVNQVRRWTGHVCTLAAANIAASSFSGEVPQKRRPSLVVEPRPTKHVRDRLVFPDKSEPKVESSLREHTPGHSTEEQSSPAPNLPGKRQPPWRAKEGSSLREYPPVHSTEEQSSPAYIPPGNRQPPWRVKGGSDSQRPPVHTAEELNKPLYIRLGDKPFPWKVGVMEITISDTKQKEGTPLWGGNLGPEFPGNRELGSHLDTNNNREAISNHRAPWTRNRDHIFDSRTGWRSARGQLNVYLGAMSVTHGAQWDKGRPRPRKEMQGAPATIMVANISQWRQAKPGELLTILQALLYRYKGDPINAGYCLVPGRDVEDPIKGTECWKLSDISSVVFNRYESLDHGVDLILCPGLMVDSGSPTTPGLLKKYYQTRAEWWDKLGELSRIQEFPEAFISLLRACVLHRFVGIPVAVARDAMALDVLFRYCRELLKGADMPDEVWVTTLMIMADLHRHPMLQHRHILGEFKNMWTQLGEVAQRLVRKHLGLSHFFRPKKDSLDNILGNEVSAYTHALVSNLAEKEHIACGVPLAMFLGKPTVWPYTPQQGQVIASVMASFTTKYEDNMRGRFAWLKKLQNRLNEDVERAVTGLGQAVWMEGPNESDYDEDSTEEALVLDEDANASK